MAMGYRGDHAVDQPSWSDADATATAIDASGPLEVCCDVDGQELEPKQQTAKVELSFVVASSGENLHHDGLGDRERSFGVDQVGETSVDCAARRPVVLHPGGCVSEDHEWLDGA